MYRSNKPFPCTSQLNILQSKKSFVILLLNNKHLVMKTGAGTFNLYLYVYSTDMCVNFNSDAPNHPHSYYLYIMYI